MYSGFQFGFFDVLEIEMLTATRYAPSDYLWDGAWPMTAVFEEDLWWEWASACMKVDAGEDIVDELAAYNVVKALDKAPVTHL